MLIIIHCVFDFMFAVFVFGYMWAYCVAILPFLWLQRGVPNNGGKCTLLELYVCYDVTETLYLGLSITNGIVSIVADRKHSSMY